jgi:hypothetical protein
VKDVTEGMKEEIEEELWEHTDEEPWLSDD